MIIVEKFETLDFRELMLVFTCFSKREVAV